MLKSVLVFAFVLAGFFSSFAQDATAEKSEYLVVRVKYGSTMSGYKYDVYLDIGVSGAHSLSGKIVNEDDMVIITDDSGKHEFKSDLDLVNYLAKNGWKIKETGTVDILDQHYATYLMERTY